MLSRKPQLPSVREMASYKATSVSSIHQPIGRFSIAKIEIGKRQAAIIADCFRHFGISRQITTAIKKSANGSGQNHSGERINNTVAEIVSNSVVIKLFRVAVISILSSDLQIHNGKNNIGSVHAKPEITVLRNTWSKPNERRLPRASPTP